MHWLLYALGTAFFEAVKDAFSKRALKNVHPFVVAWALRVLNVPLLAPFVLWNGIPPLDQQFWYALVFGTLVNVPASMMYMKAIQVGDLSKVIPMIAFTPLFLVVTSPLLVGELPSTIGLLGIIIGVAGGYLMNLQDWRHGALAPLKNLLVDPGTRLMLFVAFLWSFGANLDKIGVQASSILFWTLAIQVTIALALTPFALRAGGSSILFSRTVIPLLPISLCAVVSLMFHCAALQLTLVSYAISVKRTSALFGVLIGHFVFKEAQIKERLLGALVLLGGVFLVGIAGG